MKYDTIVESFGKKKKFKCVSEGVAASVTDNSINQTMDVLQVARRQNLTDTFTFDVGEAAHVQEGECAM